jgi:hypothetical protein
MGPRTLQIASNSSRMAPVPARMGPKPLQDTRISRPITSSWLPPPWDSAPGGVGLGLPRLPALLRMGAPARSPDPGAPPSDPAALLGAYRSRRPLSPRSRRPLIRRPGAPVIRASRR